MVYIPFKVCRSKVIDDLVHTHPGSIIDPDEVNDIAMKRWYAILEWIPKDDIEFENFRKDYPYEDRIQIQRIGMRPSTRFPIQARYTKPPVRRINK